RHGAKFSVQKSHLVSCVQQRAAQGEQAERGQMFTWDPAADGRMGRINQEDAHSWRWFEGAWRLWHWHRPTGLAVGRILLCITKYMTCPVRDPFKAPPDPAVGVH